MYISYILLDQGLACHEAFARTGQGDACRGNEQAREDAPKGALFKALVYIMCIHIVYIYRHKHLYQFWGWNSKLYLKYLFLRL